MLNNTICLNDRVVRMRGLPLIAAWALVAVVYWVLGEVGLNLAQIGVNVSAWWPASGWAVAALLVGGARMWPGVALGAGLVNASGMPEGIIAQVAAGNTAQAVVAAELLRRSGIWSQALHGGLTAAGMLLFIAIGGLLAPAIAATNGVGWIIWSGSLASGVTPLDAWLTWWMGDAIGILLVVPLVLSWPCGVLRREPPARLMEAAGALLLSGAAGYVVFLSGAARGVPIAFVSFVPVLYAALRFGPAGGILALGVISIFAAHGTAIGDGPFAAAGDLTARLLLLQAFLAVLAACTLLVAVAVQDRRRAEHDLALHAAAIEQAADAMFWIGAEGAIIHANPAAAAMCGRTVGQLVGTQFSSIAPQAEDESWRRRWSDHAVAPTSRSTSLVGRDGRMIPADLMITAVRPADGVAGCTLVIARDVSERTALQARLMQSGKMEALGRLAGGVAHDFNNLLSVIIGYSETGLAKIDNRDIVRRNFQHIHQAGDRAAGLTRQLLAFSRQQVLKPKIVDLGATVSDSLPLIERLLGPGRPIECSIAPGLQVKADPGQLSQVLMNLAANARDAMPDGGSVRIEVGEAVLDGAQAEALSQRNPEDAARIRPGIWRVLAVHDRGTGIPDSIREHLFEPFRTTKANGTGLGLATVHGIVVQSGGFIMVESSPSGTAFRIHLPLPDLRISGMHQAVRGRRPAPVRARIAVVDDQAEIRGWIAEVLSEAGHRVDRLASAEEALPSVASMPPDLLITDLVMPGMGGVSMVDHLRLRIPRLRVLYVSGWAEDQFPGGQVPERTRFLAKPFTREALLDAVDEALSEESGNYPPAETRVSRS